MRVSPFSSFGNFRENFRTSNFLPTRTLCSPVVSRIWMWSDRFQGQGRKTLCLWTKMALCLVKFVPGKRRYATQRENERPASLIKRVHLLCCRKINAVFKTDRFMWWTNLVPSTDCHQCDKLKTWLRNSGMHGWDNMNRSVTATT